MVETNTLYKLIEECQIDLLICNLPNQVLGYYHGEPDYDFILISDSISESESLFRTVLAEEIGHYFTTIGDCTPKKHLCYSNRIRIETYEERALKWAAHFLVPTHMLLSSLKETCNQSIDALSSLFLVTKELLHAKFRFLSLERILWQIDQTQYLNLSHLPSIYVFSSM